MLLAPISTYPYFNRRKNYGTRVNSRPFKGSYHPIHSAFFSTIGIFTAYHIPVTEYLNFQNKMLTAWIKNSSKCTKTRLYFFQPLFKYQLQSLTKCMKITKKRHLFKENIVLVFLLHPLGEPFTTFVFNCNLTYSTPRVLLDEPLKATQGEQILHSKNKDSVAIKMCRFMLDSL